MFASFTYKKSTLPLPTKYVVLDFETTGLNPLHERIIEVAILKYDNMQLIDKFSTLINPEILILPGITNLTGINNEMVKNKPKIEDVLTKIIDFIDDNIIIGHNITFDLRFLKAAYERINDSPINITYLDTLSIARKVIKDTGNHRLETLKKFLKIEEISHRAEEDCLVTNTLYLYCKKKIEEN